MTPFGGDRKVFISEDPTDTAETSVVFKDQEFSDIEPDSHGCYEKPKFVEVTVDLNTTSEFDLSDIVLQLKLVLTYRNF